MRPAIMPKASTVALEPLQPACEERCAREKTTEGGSARLVATSSIWAILEASSSFMGADSLIIPEELPSILSLIYANIPPIKKGTDSRVGVGFRLGPHADFQVLLELGPQRETLPLGPNDDSKKRRQIKPILNPNQYSPDIVPDTSLINPALQYIGTSSSPALYATAPLYPPTSSPLLRCYLRPPALLPPSKSNTIPMEEEQTHQEMEVVSHLSQLYSKTEPSKI
uniref:Uncharacterized protein n=1 Tax=Timema poppense TaxID=170557 RepID=A0A7R9GVJ9_TIMPO|nr:unnamed protein product [Timema poppensis]